MTIKDLKSRKKTIDPGDHLPPHIHLLAGCCAAIVAVLMFVLPIDEATSDAEATVVAVDVLEPKLNILNAIEPQAIIPLPIPQETEIAHEEGPEGGVELDDWRTTTVKPGDNLSLIFIRLGLKAEDLYTLIALGDEAKRLERVRPGQIFKIRTDMEGDLLELVYEVDEIQGLQVIRDGDSFKVSPYAQEIEKRTAFSAGTITHSLYQSALAAGMSDRLIMELVEIFGWDIDFALDIRPGDSFTVVYEENYVAGAKLGDGHILAAEFSNRGKTYRAVRYTDPTGTTHYYTPQGRGMRQAFLRSPVDFRRISSHFQPQRWHPVLGVKRPHMGVDYAAPTGTPIKASGDGTVEFIGRKGGYGNTIILQHGKRYTTLYAHMSGFAKGLRRGHRVKQGDIIGYVGMTGLATGPHLHYEFRVDGVHKDPVTVELPGAPPIDKRYLADFRKQSANLIAQLDLYSRTRLAMLNQH